MPETIEAVSEGDIALVDAALQLGGYQRAFRLVTLQKIRGRRIGSRWFVSQSSVREFLDREKNSHG